MTGCDPGAVRAPHADNEPSPRLGVLYSRSPALVLQRTISRSVSSTLISLSFGASSGLDARLPAVIHYLVWNPATTSVPSTRVPEHRAAFLAMLASATETLSFKFSYKLREPL